MSRPRGRYSLSLLVMMLLGLSGVIQAQTMSATPSADIHLGVATCAGGPCHGAASTTKKNGVLQNEYLTWQVHDKHAKAYTVLEGDLGKRIAANLGIGPATEAKECLVCHADNVPVERQGVQFKISDGVGCEACHGGGQRWLGDHVTGKVSHADLVKNEGLYPTDRPVDRAKLCLACHLGDEDHYITHKIMGAGHPRLSFELQTFTQIQPAHYVIDDIYKQRKTVYKGVQFWAVGQAVALEKLVSGIAADKHQGNGVFPELVYFDCQACHHPMSNLRWQKRASTGLGPGIPHFNDANAIMLRAIAARVTPDLAKSLDADVHELHQALSAGAGNPAEIARRLGATAAKIGDALATHDFTKADMIDMAAAIGKSSTNGDTSDYAGAEQATMAFASIIYTLNADGSVDAGTYAALKVGLNQCYGAIQKEDSYDPVKFAAAAQAVTRAMH
jgi:Cytochrome c554 and c-prime